jgi:hypothetical protein
MRFSRFSLFFHMKNSENSGGTAGVLLSSGSPDRAEARISAEHDASLAVNFREEQRKQRNPLRETPPRRRPARRSGVRAKTRTEDKLCSKPRRRFHRPVYIGPLGNVVPLASAGLIRFARS